MLIEELKVPKPEPPGQKPEPDPEPEPGQDPDLVPVTDPTPEPAYNDTVTAEQLHWHGRSVPVGRLMAGEEGTPYLPAHGKRRIFICATARPRAIASTIRTSGQGPISPPGQYRGQVGHVHIEPKREPGYEREVFLVLEFEPTFSRGGDMPQDVLSGA
jgi:hypothetical protein